VIFVPDDWLVKKENMDAVYEILNTELYSELNLSERIGVAIQRLKDIGEDILAKKLENREIILPL
jgi:hypothetical protein